MFCTMHVSQSHEPSGFLNLSPNPNSPAEVEDEVVVAAAVAAVDVEEAAEKAGRVRPGLMPEPGLAVSQATHFRASGLF